MRQTATILTVAAILGACTPQPKPEYNASRKGIDVEYKTIVVEFDKTPPDSDRVDRTASAYLDTGENGLDVVGGEDETKDLARRLEKAGVPGNRIEIKNPVADKGPWAVFRARRVHLPDCTDRDRYHGMRAPLEKMVSDDPNTPPRSFGCATRRNLGAMVADPSDLKKPATPGHPSSETTTRALETLGTNDDE